jgi:hypothetical protein
VLAIRDARYKLLLHFDPPSEDLYDLAEDPNEKSPLPHTAEKQVRRRLLDWARAHLQRSVEDRAPDLQLRAQLRDFRMEWQQPV